MYLFKTLRLACVHTFHRHFLPVPKTVQTTHSLLLIFNFIIDNNIQLSPEGEVISGGYNYTKTQSVKVYIHCSSPTLRGIVVLVFTKSDGQKNASSFPSSETFAKRHAIFLSIHKTVNIQGYSKLREPIKMCETCYPLIWQILIIIIHL